MGNQKHVLYYCSNFSSFKKYVPLRFCQLWLNTCTLIHILEPNEPRREKTNNVVVRPAQTQINLGICLVWPDSLLSAQTVAKGLSYLNADSEDSDQTGRMPRLIWVCAGRTTTLLVLSCRGSNVKVQLLFIMICIKTPLTTGSAMETLKLKMH